MRSGCQKLAWPMLCVKLSLLVVKVVHQDIYWKRRKVTTRYAFCHMHSFSDEVLPVWNSCFEWLFSPCEVHFASSWRRRIFSPSWIIFFATNQSDTHLFVMWHLKKSSIWCDFCMWWKSWEYQTSLSDSNDYAVPYITRWLAKSIRHWSQIERYHQCDDRKSLATISSFPRQPLDFDFYLCLMPFILVLIL